MAQVLRREGEFWTLSYEGRITRIADARGLHHLARLLAEPGREVHALDLTAGGSAPHPADAGPILDAAAKAAYRERVTELRAELDEAEAFADAGRAERARAELDALTAELARAAGLGGRDRRVGDAAERARVSVTKAIRSALRRIAQHDPDLAEHLGRTVRTGIFCSYQPDPRVRASWAPAAPTAVPALGTSDTALVGRADERAALRAFLAGPGGVVVLVGEPGVGKTRLAADALATAAALGMRAAAGRCSDGGETTPYLPFVQVVEALAAALPPAELRAALAPDGPHVARVAPGLRRLVPAIGAPGAVPPELEQRVVLDALRNFLDRVAGEHGIALVLDDLQWADEATLRLLEHVADGQARIVGTVRDEGLEPGRPLARTCERLVRRHAWQEVRVAPLPPDAVAEMVDALGASAGVRDAVVTQAGGNPFFVEQLHRHLAEGGSGEVPATVRVVLGHRFAALPDPARRLLDAAAVLGREGALACAVALAGLDEEQALAAVEAVEHAHLVRVIEDGDADRIAFRHDVVRHAVLAELSVRRRRLLHSRAADVLERAGAPAVVLAGHLLRAGALVPVERIVAALHRAARDALDAAAFAEAARLLEPALERAAGGARAPLLADLALAERALGRPPAAVAHWRAALALFEERGDAECAADACLEICRVEENTGRWAESLAAARRGLARLPREAVLRRVDLLAQVVTAASFAGAFDEAAAALAEVEGLVADGSGAGRAGPGARARTLTARAMHHFTRAEFPGCTAAATAALAEFERSGDPYGAGMAGTLAQRGLTATGRLEEAAACSARLAEIARHAGHVMVAHHARNVAVIDVLVSGDLEAFAARVGEDLQRCRDGGLRWLADAEAATGQVAFWRGDLPAALRHLAEAARLEPPGAYRGRYQAPLLRLLAHLGDRDGFRARWAALAGCDRSAHGGRFAVLAAAEGLAVLGAHAEAAALAGAVDTALATGLVLTGVDLRLVHTVAGLVATNPDVADGHFGAAVDQADTLPHRVEAAEARRFWGEALLRRGERARARELLTEAAERYRRLGMPAHRTLTAARLAGC